MVTLVFAIFIESMKIKNVDAPAQPVLKVTKPEPPSGEGWKHHDSKMPITSSGYMIENN